jgi:hypothetical protein
MNCGFLITGGAGIGGCQERTSRALSACRTRPAEAIPEPCGGSDAGLAGW